MARARQPGRGRAEAPPVERAAAPRSGPRPLPLHLTLATLAWQSSRLAWPLLSAASTPAPGSPSPQRPSPPNGSPSPSASRASPLPLLHSAAFQALAQRAASLPPQSLARALDAEITDRARRLLDGIEAYRAHPYRRDLSPPPVLWQEGTTRLLDYRGLGEAGPVPAATGRPILLVPSLVNRAFVLDLMAGNSFVRWLADPAGGGMRPFLVDWDAPGPAERGFTLTDYVCGRLEAALDRVLAETGEKPLVLGYCMGGLLALALAIRRQEDVSGLVLMATPWDFHAGGAETPEGALGGDAAPLAGEGATLDAATPDAATKARRLASLLLPLSPLLETFGELPADLVQALFAGLDPLLAVRKYLAFARLDPDGAKARAFVALEDWVNDGVALAAPVAREALGAWYGENAPAQGRWRIAGRPVEPQAFTKPALVLVPSADRIVPPASALALAKALPNATVDVPPLGHIGMVVSGKARGRVWGRVGAFNNPLPNAGEGASVASG